MLQVISSCRRLYLFIARHSMQQCTRKLDHDKHLVVLPSQFSSSGRNGRELRRSGRGISVLALSLKWPWTTFGTAGDTVPKMGKGILSLHGILCARTGAPLVLVASGVTSKGKELCADLGADSGRT